MAIWVGIDAREQGFDKGRAYAWAVGSLLLGMVVICGFGPVIYLIFRRTSRGQVQPTVATEVRACRYCGKQILGDPAFCPHCSAQLKSAEEIHRKS